MYVGRTMEQLQNLPYAQWSMEELAYHRDVMTNLQDWLNETGISTLTNVEEEIQNRGGFPKYGGDYDGHGTTIHYD
ncbi:hypothetical protein [Tumebacillus flagellatus]|uniref:Cytosolic protein n=1 Tax=Tumebacillus flagellatus TaxID=1157490 RepID=A0A074LTR6_9BACL|nr:hypothetical protein [Tumebacillus flagellatus]KEO84524.1 hypothetical protein EL26_03110 [Tumebacillus flagellatus]